jgi:heme-degrading monooxygenase HmoA
MFVVLYRWRVKPHLEKQFIEAWSEITAYYRENFDSSGSRLHRGDDGIFYGYAQWKSQKQRDEAFKKRPDFEAGKKLREAVEESLPETHLEVLSDYLILPEK